MKTLYKVIEVEDGFKSKEYTSYKCARKFFSRMVYAGFNVRMYGMNGNFEWEEIGGC